MELFSEIYGCYYTVVSRILDQAEDGITKDEIEKIVSEGGFYDSAFHLLPSLFSSEWNLLDETGGVYRSRLTGKVRRPLSSLEKSWLKALTNDPRISLFLDQNQVTELQDLLHDTEPLYEQDDFHVYDRHSDGDDYQDPGYISRFRMIAEAIKKQVPLLIEYSSPGGRRTKRYYHPNKLCYSPRDDKFRLYCAVFNGRQKKLQRMILNLARISAVQISDSVYDIKDDLDKLFKEAVCDEPIVLEISKERNALERCMLQFASFERQTEYDRDRDIYTCRIWFDQADETEMLIRVLSFGPVVKVLGPESFLNQLKQRLRRQFRTDGL